MLVSYSLSLSDSASIKCGQLIFDQYFSIVWFLSLQLAIVYTILGAMALIFCLVTSIIHLHNYERELSTCHLWVVNFILDHLSNVLFRFADIWSIRLFVHNGLSVMLAWQISLIGFSALYTCNSLVFPAQHLSQSTIELIGVGMISALCLIALVYTILMSCFFFNTLCHVLAGWIFLVFLTFSYWQHHQENPPRHLLHISFYISTALLSFIVCLHLVLAFFRYSGTTWKSLTSSTRNHYRHAMLQGRD